MNNYQKGKKLEKLCEEILKDRGYKILFKSVFVKFHMIDFANLFDMVGVNEAGIWRFVQVKSRFDKKQFFEIVDFKQKYGNGSMVFEMWVWNDEKKDFVVMNTSGITLQTMDVF